MTPLVLVDDIVAEYHTARRTVRALDGASLSIERGEHIGIVGESGSGKTTLGLLLGRLLPAATRYPRGRVLVDGQAVLDLPADRIARLRRERLGFIPQDPVGALDPTLRIGRQLALALRGTGAATGRAGLLARLDQVQIHEPERVLRLYPHEISGGMAQRVTIAMAMARTPDLLIADEPTAALDAQVRQDILRLLFSLAAENGTTVLWLSHDLSGVARWCGRIAVMYGGRVVEDGPASDVLGEPRHPYTAALAAADPARAAPGERLRAIGGVPPALLGETRGCAFAPRCGAATDLCHDDQPATTREARRLVLCHHPVPRPAVPLPPQPMETPR
ncbi:ABC transporter ATP-binding protein [Streptomyces sp. IB2014 016-6]|uniref:ABC transporter ATP-binding protein n=1 Tax=Streptomyces sp. IB2014 016-6 TaxID=2517818 RepID=UPI0011CAD1E0|nr:ABC transporter ATP-binding protein [Streptomyces sp. IB2014 016-6]TXL86672.1 ABC transporter ATP-binding protein [Streptomyces sp. IB2014 016-6]